MKDRHSGHIAVVIPAFCVAKQVAEVIARVPALVATIVAVEDHSPDSTGDVLDRLASSNPRLVVIHHEKNAGVGGATKTGYLEALRRGAEIVVKVDGDGQMDPESIGRLVAPIVDGQAEYAKGNRFHEWNYLKLMPVARRIGNLGLSLLIKMASGYWTVFDPTNGFTAISADTLRRLDFDRLQNRYLFESSMLVELYRLNARVRQLATPAIYGDEVSSLSVWKSLFQFPPYLLRAMIRRFMYRYVWQDFTAISVFVIVGLVGVGFGVGFGTYHWIRSSLTGHPATTGTVMLSALPIILGFQLLLQAVVLDIQNVPK